MNNQTIDLFKHYKEGVKPEYGGKIYTLIDVENNWQTIKENNETIVFKLYNKIEYKFKIIAGYLRKSITEENRKVFVVETSSQEHKDKIIKQLNDKKNAKESIIFWSQIKI